MSTPARAARVLDRPFSVGGLTVPNRIVMAPMTRAFSPGGISGPDVAAYYARRAAARVGLIVTEGTFVGHPSAGDNADVPRFHGDEQLAGWSRVAEAVHAAGGKIVPQLWHLGMARVAGEPPFPDAPAVGPSGIATDGSGRAGRAMTLDDIDDVVRAFAEAAGLAERLGFDGVELHGAHGYLIDQFLWARTNQRTDSYGGDLASRARFASEIVAAVRKEVSSGFPVIFRFSQWKGHAYDGRLAENPGELESLLTPLAEAGADVFHASTRRFWLPEFEGSDLNLAGWTKKLTGRPSITVGSIGIDREFTSRDRAAAFTVTDIDALLDRMERDEFDLAAVGRVLLADPEWAAKILDGRTGELAPYTDEATATLT